MEESFVVLPPAAASMYKPASEGGGTHLLTPGGSPSGPLQANNSRFHSSITVLNRAFATAQTQVEDVNRDIKAYEACLQRLELESRDALSEADFLREKKKVEEEERRLEAAIEEAEKQCASVDTEPMELELKSKRFKELEEWWVLNIFMVMHLIRKLIHHGKTKNAVDFAYAFDLIDDFHPGPLLKAYMNTSKKAAQEVVYQTLSSACCCLC